MTSILAYPFKKMIESILQRFLGKFLHPERKIDMKNATFKSDYITLNNLDMNVDIFNQAEAVKNSELVFIKVNVGTLRLNIEHILRRKIACDISNVSFIAKFNIKMSRSR
jgi:hypothetical protein